MTAAIKINYVPVTYRDPNPTDEGFLYHSWLKSFRQGSSWASSIPAQIYFNNHKVIVSKLLREAGIVIAANPENPTQIFGYGVYSPTSGNVTVLHYLYVKHPFRRLGIGTDILRVIKNLSCHDLDLPVAATHMTSVGAMIQEKWKVIYNPYVLGAKE